MNKISILFAFIIACSSFNGTAQTNQSSEKNIVIGTIDSLYSEVLKEHREFWVHTPTNFDRTKKYPVIYVLDARSHFHVITGMLKRLTPLQIPESIVVGVVSTDGTRDYSPTNVSFSRGHKTETSGGASNFKKFLNEELQCYITDTYPTENNTTIIGHSFSGLFVVYSYLHDADSFDNYVAIEPSLWWDKEDLVKETQDLLDTGNRKEKSLYVAVANSLGKAMDTVKVRRDKREQTEQIRANLKFHDLLVKNRARLDYTWEYFADEDHGGVTVPGQYNGIRDVFSWFPFHELWRFNTPKSYSAKELTGPFYEHYARLSTRMGREMKPDWALVNDIGTFMMEGHDLPKKAKAYFDMNIHFYPNESKSYLALGNLYLLEKEKKKAIANFKKAVELDGNAEAKRKLMELGN